MKFREIHEQNIERVINGSNNSVNNKEMERVRLEALEMLDDDLAPMFEGKTKIEELKELRESLLGQVVQEKEKNRNI